MSVSANYEIQFVKGVFGLGGKYLTLKRCQIYYEDSIYGEETIILIHGFISSLLCWRPIISHLKKHFRVIALDLPGFGETKVSRNYSFTLKNYGSTIIEFIKALNINNPIYIVGHSLGGQIALQSVVLNPDLCSKLFLISASAQRERPPWFVRVFCYLPFMSELAYRFYFNDELVDVAIAKILSGGAGLEKEVLQPYIDMCKSKEVVGAVLKLGKAREDDLSGEKLQLVKQDTFLLWGREDEVVPLTEGMFLKNSLQNSTLKILEHCGHLPMEEYPYHVLNYLYTFLK